MQHGIYLYASSGNVLTGSVASDNSYHGIFLESSRDNLLVDNVASGNDNGIRLWSSNNNSLMGNAAFNNNHGIYLYASSGNVLRNNIAWDNAYQGIYLWSGSNILVGNTADSNAYGIFLTDSAGNVIYDNFFNNTYNLFLGGGFSSNSWNTIKQPGINVVGGPWLAGTTGLLPTALATARPARTAITMGYATPTTLFP